MSATFIDDRDPGVTFSPRTAWSRQLICDECRGVEGGGAFVGQVAAAARGGTWTTALGNNPTSNVTIRFRGSGVQAHFILFTRVQGASNEDLPPENMAQISFFINGTLFDPAPIAFRHWWNPDVPQQPFIENVILLAQQGLGPGTHDLTIQYAIDTTLGLPQVLLAFDSLEVTPFQDAPGTPNHQAFPIVFQGPTIFLPSTHGPIKQPRLTWRLNRASGWYIVGNSPLPCDYCELFRGTLVVAKKGEETAGPIH
ncbi:hypothetical protein BKA70DRAFT_592986 [Coprinopsis sp. MPI-PUGE-AT-0042]|nr:hypothetical protein BKA70DRAFT_592986 [Coprinopsis sp. MPI-PUGE-AT-0042]